MGCASPALCFIQNSEHPCTLKTLLVILGPTAVGKTRLALNLAERFGSPILNADSRQIYRDIPVGTAAPTAEEQARVKHYFVGQLALDDYFSAAAYEEEAMRVLSDEFTRRDVCVLSGGSMMYVDAVCHGIDNIPTVDDDTRRLIKERYEQEGLAPLAAELRLLDPEYYAQCDLRNPKRIVHALEICYMTGRTFTSFRTGQRAERPFRIVRIGLNRERPELFARINQRTRQMVDTGLVDEARRVLPFRSCNSLNTVGYKEMFLHFDGAMTLDEATEKISRNTRVYAKKQLTWFRRDDSIRWFHPDDEAGILQYLDTNLA